MHLSAARLGFPTRPILVPPPSGMACINKGMKHLCRRQEDAAYPVASRGAHIWVGGTLDSRPWLGPSLEDWWERIICPFVAVAAARGNQPRSWCPETCLAYQVLSKVVERESQRRATSAAAVAA